jgi:hypothetical protein
MKFPIFTSEKLNHSHMKNFKIGLLGKIIIAIIAGILKKLDRLASSAEEPQHP